MRTFNVVIRMTVIACFAAIFFSAVLISCRDGSIDLTSQSKVEDAIKDARAKYLRVQATLDGRFKRRYQINPQWDNSELQILKDGLTSLVVPYGLDPITEAQLILVFTNKANSFLQGQVIEWKPSIESRQNRTTMEISDFQGRANFYTIDGTFIVSVSYDKGKFDKYLTPFTKYRNSGARTTDGPTENLNVVTVIGQRPQEYPMVIDIPSTYYSPSGGIYNNYNYGGSNISNTASPGIDCNSFDFRVTGTNWQEAALSSYHFVIVNISEGKSAVINITSRITIGVPLERADGTKYPPGIAAEIAADVIENVSGFLFDKYKYASTMPSESQVGQEFYTKANEYARAYGGSAGRMGSSSPLIQVKSPNYAFSGNGNCY